MANFKQFIETIKALEKFNEHYEKEDYKKISIEFIDTNSQAIKRLAKKGFLNINSKIDERLLNMEVVNWETSEWPNFWVKLKDADENAR